MTFSPGPASFIRGPKSASPSNTRGGSRMPELGPYGSVRGALSNERPYRDLRNVVANYPLERSHRFVGNPAEFRPGRPLAFELQRRRYAARGWVLPGSSASVLHGRWRVTPQESGVGAVALPFRSELETQWPPCELCLSRTAVRHARRRHHRRW